MIRILIVDDHPAMRAGLSAVLRGEPAFVALDAAASATDVWPALNRTKPDVVVLDYHLPGDDGLVLCRRIKRRIPAPAVLLYSAYADASLTIPARLAGADGLINKSAPIAGGWRWDVDLEPADHAIDAARDDSRLDAQDGCHLADWRVVQRHPEDRQVLCLQAAAGAVEQFA